MSRTLSLLLSLCATIIQFLHDLLPRVELEILETRVPLNEFFELVLSEYGHALLLCVFVLVTFCNFAAIFEFASDD